jgi:hypothetical protein
MIKSLGYEIYVTPSGLPIAQTKFCYNHFTLSGFIKKIRVSKINTNAINNKQKSLGRT